MTARAATVGMYAIVRPVLTVPAASEAVMRAWCFNHLVVVDLCEHIDKNGNKRFCGEVSGPPGGELQRRKSSDARIELEWREDFSNSIRDFDHGRTCWPLGIGDDHGFSRVAASGDTGVDGNGAEEFDAEILCKIRSAA